MVSIFFTFIFQLNSLVAQKVWTLDECIAYALEHNLQVSKKQLEMQNTLQDAKLAYNQKLPSVSAALNNQTNFGQSQDIFGTVKRNDNYNNNIGASSQILVFNNYRLKKELAKANNDFITSEYALENAKQNVQIQVTRAYLNVLLNKEAVIIADSTLENAEKLLERSKSTTIAGTTALSVQYEAEANYATEKRKLQLAKIDVRRALLELSQLLQLNDTAIADVQPIKDENIYLMEFSFTNSEINKDIYESQPIIKMYESAIYSAKVQSEIIKAQYGPSIIAGAGAGTSYFNAFQSNVTKSYWLQSRDNFAQQLSLNISIPIFDKNKKNTLLRKAELAEDLARNELNIYKQIIQQDIEKIIFDIESSYESYRASLESVKSSTLAAQFAQKSYEAGMSSIYDITNSRNNLVAAQSALLQGHPDNSLRSIFE